MADSNSFRCNQNIKNAFLNFKKSISFSKELQEKYSRMLSIFDQNGDNKIDAGELQNIWKAVEKFAGSDKTLSVSEADDCVMDAAKGLTWWGAAFTSKNTTSKELFEFLNVLTKTVMPKESATQKSKTSQVDMRANIKKMAESKGTKLTDEQVEDWNKVIVAEAKRYNIPAEVIIVIIRRECGFDDSGLRDGCMQVIPGTLNNIKRDRYGVFNKVNSKCRGDTIQSLKTHNLTDRSTGIKAGVLVFQTSYAQAVAQMKGWLVPVGKGKTQPDIVKAAEALKAGTVKLTPAEQKEVMRLALEIYNASGIKKSYAKDCMQRLDNMGYDYSRPIVT